MARNNAVIVAVLLVVIGVKLIGDAIAGFQRTRGSVRLCARLGQ
jgi:hypothetical protein